MSDSLTIRRANPDDAAEVTRHRYLMFEEMGDQDMTMLAASLDPFTEWVTPRLIDNRYIGLLAVDGNTVAAGAGMLVMDFPPGPLSLTSCRGYILNVYTYPAYRRRGLAQRLVGGLLAIAREQHIHVVSLHASNAGKPVYDGMGFSVTNEMRIRVS
jgi:ribosomal protein S18 acetylase RimI-like enzyme